MANAENHASQRHRPPSLATMPRSPPPKVGKLPHHIVNLRNAWKKPEHIDSMRDQWDCREKRKTKSGSEVALLKADGILCEFPGILFGDYKQRLIDALGEETFTRNRVKLRMKHSSRASNVRGSSPRNSRVNRSSSFPDISARSDRSRRSPGSLIRSMTQRSVPEEVVTFHLYCKKRPSRISWKKRWFPQRFEIWDGLLKCYDESEDAEHENKSDDDGSSAMDRTTPHTCVHLRNCVVQSMYITTRNGLPFHSFIVRNAMGYERGAEAVRQMSIKLGGDVRSEVETFHRALHLASVTRAVIPKSELRELQVIGRGSTGKVFSARYCECTVAVKHLSSIYGNESTSSDLPSILNELRVLERVRHRNIVALFGICIDGGAGFGSKWSIECDGLDATKTSTTHNADDVEQMTKNEKKKKGRFGLSMSFKIGGRKHRAEALQSKRRRRGLENASVFSAKSVARMIQSLRRPKDSVASKAAREGLSNAVPQNMNGGLPRGVSIVMEYCKFPLNTFVHSKSLEHRWSRLIFKHILNGIVSGMKHLHNLKIEHRDLKPQNVLLTDSLTVKICDFGLAKLDDVVERRLEKNTGCGTPQYMAPEIIKAYSSSSTSEEFCGEHFSADVFAFALIMWEMWMRKRPYEKFAKFTVMRRVQSGYRLPLNSPPFPPGVKSLVARCWSQSADSRPSFREIWNDIQTTAFVDEIRRTPGVWFSATQDNRQSSATVVEACGTSTDAQKILSLEDAISSGMVGFMLEDTSSSQSDVWSKTPSTTPSVSAPRMRSMRISRPRHNSCFSEEDRETDDDDDDDDDDEIATDFGALSTEDPQNSVLLLERPAESHEKIIRLSIVRHVDSSPFPTRPPPVASFAQALASKLEIKKDRPGIRRRWSDSAAATTTIADAFTKSRRASPRRRTALVTWSHSYDSYEQRKRESRSSAYGKKLLQRALAYDRVPMRPIPEAPYGAYE